MYTESDKRLIAYEVARARGSVLRAAETLRNEYESFRTIGESTIRRLMQNSAFCKQVDDCVETVRIQQEEVIRENERKRMTHKLEGTLVGQLQNYDKILNEAINYFQQSIEQVQNDPEKNLPAASKALEVCAKIVEKVRSQTIPVIAESRQVTLLIEIYAQVASRMFGITKTKEFAAQVKKDYLERMDQLEKQDSAAPGAEETEDAPAGAHAG